MVRTVPTPCWCRRSVAVALTSLSLSFAAAPASAARARTAEVLAAISAADAALAPADRAEKHAAMAASPTAFLRGTNYLYWQDLGRSPLLARYGDVAATRTFLAGDMHVDNFGAFADDHGDVVYAIDDVDEAIIGDYQLDVWRAAISVVLVARERGFAPSTVAALVDAFTEAYLDAMASYAGTSQETTRTFTQATTYGLLDDFLRDVARTHSRAAMLGEWTVVTGGVRRLDTSGNPDLASVSAAVDADLRSHMAAYRASLSGGAVFPPTTFAVKGVAQRLHAGLGSLGVPRYYVLLEGATSGQDDDLLLDVKAQGVPSGAPYVSAAALAATTAASGGDPGRRVIGAAKALGYRVDDLLGQVTLSDGRTYSVRERSPFKATFDTDELTTVARLQHLAEQWGAVLATAHARADRDWDPAVFPASLDGEIDARTDGDHAGFRALVRAVAFDEADQVELDFASFVASR